MRRADALVTSSAWEGFGVTVLEAMFEEVPVVASDIGPHREALGGHGVLFPPGDADALAGALLELDRVPQARAEMAAAARRRAAEFSIEACVDQHLALYDELADPRRRGVHA
jgi:glycosyltransferase involved in cell wall biosynthesis